MAKAAAVLIVACFTFMSLMGFWFHVAVGPSHGRGLEVAVVAGALALVAGVAGAWLAARDPS